MRLCKFQVVVVAVVCLLISGSAQGQFGKLKSLAKDKVGMGDKQPAATASSAAKGPYGEAKAVLAPGVKKSVDVARQGGGTPEASIATVAGGGPQVVAIKVSHVDATRFDAVRGYSPCNKVSNFQILSPTQMKVTIDLTESKSGGACSLYFRSGGNTVFTSNVSIRGKK